MPCTCRRPTLRVENIKYRNRIDSIFVFRYRTDVNYRYHAELSYRSRIEIVYRYGIELDCPSMSITTLISSNELPC